MHCSKCRSPSFSDPCFPCKVRAKERAELMAASQSVQQSSPAYDSDLYRCLKIILENLHTKACGVPGYDIAEWQALNLALHTAIARGIMAATPLAARQVAEAIVARTTPPLPPKRSAPPAPRGPIKIAEPRKPEPRNPPPSPPPPPDLIAQVAMGPISIASQPAAEEVAAGGEADEPTA